MRSGGNNFNYFTEKFFGRPSQQQLVFLLTSVIHCRSDYWYGHGRTGDDGLGTSAQNRKFSAIDG